jgi:hypothetical protein
MPISDEKRKGQEDYAVAMAIMKEMKAKVIINKDDISSGGASRGKVCSCKKTGRVV